MLVVFLYFAKGLHILPDPIYIPDIGLIPLCSTTIFSLKARREDTVSAITSMLRCAMLWLSNLRDLLQLISDVLFESLRGRCPNFFMCA